MAASLPIEISIQTHDAPRHPSTDDLSSLRPWHLVSLWHLTSLDAPSVAVSWCMAFACAAHVRLPFWIPCILALGTWAVYIGDRLLDAWRARTPLRARHHFHWRHRRIFVPVALVALCAAMALVFCYMPLAARGRNSLLAAVALAYFTGVHRPGAEQRALLSAGRRKFPMKELLVGIIFTLVCAAPTWARITGNRMELTGLAAVVLYFSALAWLNCHAIEVWESVEVFSSLTPSSTLRQGRTFYLAITLAVGIAALCSVLVLMHQPRPALLLAAGASSAAMLAALDRCQARFNSVTLRAVADLVLLTPLLLLALW